MTMIRGLISLAIGSIFLVSVFISTIKAQNIDAWSTAEKSLYGTITTIGIAGFVYGVANVFGLV